MYRLFDGTVACDFPLPGIPAAQRAEADVQIVLDHGAVDEADFDWFHAWRETDGELILCCARQRVVGSSSRHLLRFPELADFLVSGNTVTCHPHPGCRKDTLRHLVLDQVIPRVWAHHGHLVLHASAVQLADGRVIAFLGESGWGKSTLAAALLAQGGRLLSDDSVSLRGNGEQVRLIPSYTGLRLNADSITTLGMQEQGWTTVSHYSDKQRLAPAMGEDHDPLWLDTLYIMAEPGKAHALSIKVLAGAELIATLIKRSFLLDINDSHCATRQLREAGAVLSAMPKTFSIDYPRDYKQLPTVCDFLSGEASP